MPTGQNPRRRERASQQEAKAPEPAPEGDLTPPLLDQVMSQTAAQLAEPAQLDPAVRAALVAVARQFTGQALVVEPVGAALFEALLAAQFPFFAERPALLAKAAREVARALLADPSSHRRVEHLWLALLEEAS
jgi:hypothetical protein